MRVSGIPWRDTARPIRVGILDARALTGLAVWLLHMCWFTFWLSLATVALFSVLEHVGITPPAAWRAVRQGLFPAARSCHGRYDETRRLRW